MKWQTKLWLIVIPILVGLGIGIVFGDESGCGDLGNSESYTIQCYLPLVYQQNQILIQEQNQTNRLMAAEICTHEYGSLDFNIEVFDRNVKGILGESHYQYYLMFHQCIDNVLSDTK